MEINELIKIVRPYTMASEERLQWKAETAQRIIAENIPGDFVECGVWKGGASAIQAHYAIPAGRTFHLFDSWQGMPVPTAEDTPSANGVTAESEIGKCKAAIEDVAEVFSKVGISTAKSCYTGNLRIVVGVEFHPGWFEESFRWTPEQQQIAMLSIDSDWYFSEMACWRRWWDFVVPGGFVYIDDYYYWPGSNKAANDFFRERGEQQIIHRIGHSAWIQKNAGVIA